MTKEKILHVVCREFNLTPDDIFQPDRTEGARNGNKVFARKLCMTFSRLYNLNNESEIGDYFHRDRCTVYAAVKTVANDIKTNRNRKLIYDNILIELEKEEPLVTRKKIYCSCPKDNESEYDNHEYQDADCGGLQFQIPQ